MLGGLARRAGAIDQIRRKVSCVLLVDAGESFFEKRGYDAGELSSARDKADFILRSYLQMGYDAINISLQDWAGQCEYLPARIKEHKYPFVSANLNSLDPLRTLPPHFIKVDICGCAVGILGVMRDQPGIGCPAVTADDPVNAIRKTVAELRKGCLFVILLSDLGTRTDTDVANSIEGINVIVGSGSGPLHTPRRVKQTYLCYPKAEGQWLGRLDITIASNGAVIRAGHEVLILDDRYPEDERLRREVEAFLGEEKTGE